MNSYLTIIPAFFGCLGFAMFFNMNKSHILISAVNGAFAWFVFVLFHRMGSSLFICSLAGTLAASIGSEVLARVKKAPSTIFYIPGIVPMVPGSNLYYMIEALMHEDMAEAGIQAYALLWTILGIAVGAAAVLGVIWTKRKISVYRRTL